MAGGRNVIVGWLKGYWIAIAGGILAIIAVAALIRAGIDEQRSYERQAQADTAYYAEKAKKQYGWDCQGLTTADHDKCRYEITQSARDKQRDTEDLKAQLVTSAWTRQMGFAAIIGMAVSIFGVGLVFVTFRETRRSANEAKRSVDAFIQAECPHLRFLPGSFKADESNMEIGLRVENFGGSPAVLDTIAYALVDSKRYPAIALEQAPEHQISHQPKVEGGSKASLSPFKMAKGLGYVVGRVRYSSRFSRDHTAHFLFKISPAEGGQLLFKQRRPNKKLGWPEDS